jgi:IrrE N-terminal-like domain
VSNTRELHERAMELFEASLLARHAEDEGRMNRFLAQALKMECEAADTVADDYALEPTRSLLHRSAAAMALSNFDTKTARRYVEAAFEGKPPAEVESELQKLSEQITILEDEMKSYALKAPTGLTPVQQVIRKFTSNPPTDIVSLANALGLSVLFLDLGTDAGEIVRDIRRGGFSGYSIRINTNDPHVRQRYTIGHETAHFLLHRDRVQNRLRDDRMYRSGLGTTKEKEADALAADLLMPKRIIGELRKSGINNAEELAAKFDVSVIAMKRRLGIRRRN